MIPHSSGTIEVGKGITIGLDSPGILMTKTKNGRLSSLTLAGPSRKLNRMLVWVTGIYKTQSENYRTITDEKQNTTLFIVDLPQGVYCGKSVEVKLE